MANSSKCIEHLNIILGNELIAINQYFLHSKMCAHWGYSKLAKVSMEESIDEMKHAEKLSDRILQLGGVPNLQKLGKLNIGETVEEMLAADRDLELKAIPDLKAAIEYLDSVKDFASSDLLTSILVEEESHLEFLTTQLSLIKSLGLTNYLQSQV